MKERIGINASKTTIWRYTKGLDFSYQNIKRKFQLSTKSKKKRVEMAKKWILSSINWNRVIFSDEKLFTLNGIDSFYCWIKNGQSPKRIKKVMKSPGLMVWAMILPNGLLSYSIMKGKQNSDKYIAIIQNKAMKIIQLNYKEKMIFQQDNCPIHMSRSSMKFFQESNIQLLEWPAYSPDLNIIENVWPILSNHIHNGNNIKNLTELEMKIKEAFLWFNETKKDMVDNLYKSVIGRLISVISKRGERLKY